MKKFVYLIMLIGCIQLASALVTYNGSTELEYNSGSPVIQFNLSTNVLNLTNGLLVVTIGTVDGVPSSNSNVSSVTVNSTNMQLAVWNQNKSGANSEYSSYIFYSVTNGTLNDTQRFQINSSSGNGFFSAHIVVSWYEGLNQTNVLDVTNSKNISGLVNPIDIILNTTVDNALIITTEVSEDNNVPLGINQTIIQDYDLGGQTFSSAYNNTNRSAGLIGVGFNRNNTGLADPLVIVGASFKPFTVESSPSVSVPNILMLSVKNNFFLNVKLGSVLYFKNMSN